MDKFKELLEECKEFVADDPITYGLELSTKEVAIVVEALEKQVAKKPRYYTDMYNHKRPGCPGCPRNEILYAGQRYCNVCGTKIDWSEE